MRGVVAIWVVVLCLVECGADHASVPSATTASPEETPPAPLQRAFPQSSFHAVTGALPTYQATQLLSAAPKQSLASSSDVMTVSML
jgi:hypothetical protein